MAKILKVTPNELRGGANRLDDEKTTVSGIAVPDHSSAASGLAGFASASKLYRAHDTVSAALQVSGDRFGQMGSLLRETATTFEFVSSTLAPGAVKEPWMSTHVAEGLTAMGDMPTTVPRLRT
ncbi:hypothetical protein MABM_30050 [Mycobacteroides abscessus]|uniref:hypothetical protein n=1 Tax=Mycobacteroides abscessus TaxID=36809 RepID=UPI00068676E7|nr:hypothetical protein [Mycobacteroides abscessus]BBZ83089.1 hypothetical protein MABM_30050 [Mycobacteroides abscessus]